VESRRDACHAGPMGDVRTREVGVTLAGDAVGDLGERLRRTRLAPADSDGWERGAPRSWLAALLADWEAFDAGAFQARLDRLTHREAVVDGQLIHLVHVPGRGPDPLPLLLTHGWPGSFCEYLDLIPLLADPAVRKAIATGINDDEIVNSGVKQFSDKAKPLGNRIWLTGQPPYVDHSGDYAKGNTAAATKLLADAGYQKGADGIYAKGGQRLSFRFSTTSGNKLREDTGVLFQSQMKKMGVDIQIDNKPSKVLFGVLPKGDFDISLFAYVGNPFAVSNNKGVYTTNSGSNFGKYSSPKVDQLFDQATSELDEKKAADIGNQIDQQLWDDMVSVPLYQKPTFIAYYNKYGNIHDNPNQEGPLYNVGDWGLK